MSPAAVAAAVGRQLRRPTFTPGVVAGLMASAFLVLHLAFVPPTPTGIDGANSALAVRGLDAAAERSVEAAYPVFIALGRAARAIIEWLPIAPSPDFGRREVYALAIWNAVLGAIAVFSFSALFRAIDRNDRRAVGAAALTITCPLFWFTGIRAIGDVSGLAVASAAQALIASAFAITELPVAARARLLIGGAFLAGLAMGFRPQTSWLTLPLLGLATIAHVRRSGGRVVFHVAASATGGALLWSLPLIVSAGGVSSYLATLVDTGADGTLTRTLFAAPSLTGLIGALVQTIAYPWTNKYLAIVIVALSAWGAVTLNRESRRAGLVLLLCFAPYTLFHVLFHDTSLVALALPVVPALAYLTVRGMDAIGHRHMVWGTASLVTVSLLLAMPPVFRHARAGGPSFQAVDAVLDARSRTASHPTLAMHHSVSRVLRLADLPPTTLPSPANYEWLELVRYWNGGGSAPVWFLAEPERTDLALIDPHARRLLASYRMPFDRRFFMTGVRPTGVDWYEIHSPSWYAGEGWALTAEAAGVADADGRSPDRGPITAYVRRRDDAAVAIVGGRHLDPAGKPARFYLSIAGRTVDSWVVAPNPGTFLRLIPLAGGSLQSPDATTTYVPLQIHSTASDGSRQRTRTAITQFDVQSADRTVFGYGSGWFDQERETDGQRSWRWMGPVAALRIHHAERDVVLHLSGEAPLDLLERPATLLVHAGEWIIDRVTVGGSFNETIHVPAAALAASKGVLTLASDRSFVPGAAVRNGDRRVLALRMFDVRVVAEPSSAVPRSAGIGASVVR